MLSPSPAALLRILAPEEAEERARNREAWADLWQAIAREADADAPREPRDDETTAEDSAAA